jgi:hypothetical protein
MRDLRASRFVLVLAALAHAAAIACTAARRDHRDLSQVGGLTESVSVTLTILDVEVRTTRAVRSGGLKKEDPPSRSA